MIWVRTIFTIILFQLTNFVIFGQTEHELDQLKLIVEPETHHVHYKNFTQKDNEIQQVVSFLFLFYKNFISSQDGASCVFYPSCSVYAVQAIQKQGIIKGTMNAFDRLTRCNVLSPEQYEINPKTHLLYDPVE